MMTSSLPADDQQFREKQAVLSQLLERSLEPLGALDMAAWRDTLAKAIQRVASDRFRVFIMGEFKRGKSTFINALLHQEVLPAFVTPCTAVINEVKWGEEKRALLHFRKPLPDTLPQNMPTRAVEHARRHAGAEEIPALEVPVEELEKYVVIPDPGKDQAASVAESPYDRVEVFWPLDLCQNGVEIIDSPGLNEHRTRTKTTKDYLSHVDAVIVVMSVHNLAGMSELSVIDHDVRTFGHDHIFFVCNRYDELRKQSDRESIVKYAREKLAERTHFGNDGIFFISALKALDGRVEGDPQQVEKSGILPLEKELARFLVNDRGRVKLLQPANQLARGLKTALHETIPARRKLLDDDLSTLERRHEKAKPHFERALRGRDQLLRQVRDERQRLGEMVRREVVEFLRDLANRVPSWARDVQTTDINVLAGGLEDQARQLAAEVTQGVQPRLEAECADWQEKSLKPILDTSVEEMTERISISVANFFVQLEGLREQLTGQSTSPSRPDDGLGDEGLAPLERVFAGGFNFGLDGAGVAVSGVNLEASGLVSGLMPQILVAVGAALLGFTNPITIAAILAGGLLGQALFRSRKMTEQLKDRVVGALAEQLRQSASEEAQAVAAAVFDQTEALEQAISAGLDREIATIREQVDAVLQAKKAGLAQVEESRRKIDSAEGILRELEAETGRFIQTLPVAPPLQG